MMQMSTRGRYALRAMVDLAMHSEEGPVARRDIAERQSISADYVAQLFRQLREAGLVEGIKGRGGGYVLTRDAAAIRVGDVVRAAEGPIAPVPCAIPSKEAPCSRVDGCVAHMLWKQLSRTMAEFLDSITLEDLCERARQLAQPDRVEQ
ncbi:MAG: Rrf2 family transcriptional regulator [Anaerolineae bacterium]